MWGRFFIVISVLSLSACAGGGGYTRAKVVTPQVFDCGAPGLASIRVWSPSEATMNFMGKKFEMKRSNQGPVPLYKGDGAEYANHAVFGRIKLGSTVYDCDVRPRDFDPQAEPIAVPEVEQRVPRLDVAPYM